MSKTEIKQEIALVKQKLMNDNLGNIERSELMIALIALYECAMKASE